MVKVELEIKEEVFTNDKGEDINYLSCVANVAGAAIRFYPKPEDKKLLNYLLGKPAADEKKGGK